MNLVLRAVILLLALQTPSSTASEAFELTCRTIAGTDAHRYVQNLYGKALERLGYELKIRNVNRLRAQVLANSGTVDGMCGVISDTERSLKGGELLRMDLVVGIARIELWVKQSRRETIKELLNNPEANIAHSRGDQTVLPFLDPFRFGNIQGAPNELAGFKMLLAGRVDGFVAVNLLSQGVFELSELDEEQFHKIVLGEQKFYPYLHEKHRALFTPLKRELEKELLLIGGPFE